MPRRRKYEDKENLDRWLLTYADLITLLLAFFIVMYSMSQVDAKKFGRMSDALSGVLKGGTVIIKRGSQIGIMPGGGVLKTAVLKSIGESIENDFMGKGNEKLVNTEVSERGLVIHIMESALFKLGSADLTEKAIKTLDVVAEHIKSLPNHIRIEGHTDNRPINTLKYPSNWELSSARATEVVRYFIDEHNIRPDKISALGYGEFRPLVPNNTEDNRAKNRRVDILIMTMEITASEPTSQFYNQN
ncbi:MAG TPA: chemotaxis protein MotB [candidate division Zixibacteria bacterium]|nr:chemotaxis protein MotB [candidate division Zixibacteria bacterium]